MIPIGDLQAKLLSIGIGWALGESIFNNFVYNIMQIWGNEIKIEYITTALSANFDLLEVLTLVGLVHTLALKTTTQAMSVILYTLILMRFMVPVYLRSMREGHEEYSTWYEEVACVLGGKAVFAVMFWLVGKAVTAQ